MAARRAQAIPSLSADTQQETEKSDIAPAVPSSTILKLAVFTLAMFTLPLAAYFGSVRTLFAGNATYAAALAAFVANLVVVAYVIVAVIEDQGEAGQKGKKSGKAE